MVRSIFALLVIASLLVGDVALRAHHHLHLPAAASDAEFAGSNSDGCTACGCHHHADSKESRPTDGDKSPASDTDCTLCIAKHISRLDTAATPAMWLLLDEVVVTNVETVSSPCSQSILSLGSPLRGPPCV